MEYIVEMAVSQEFEINKENLVLFNLGELGKQAGMGIISQLTDYKKGFLTIITKLQYTIIPEHGDNRWLGRCNYLTSFYFQNAAFLQRGPTQRTLAALHECTDLAQAHAYGHFSLLSHEHGLPMVATVLQPLDRIEPSNLAFLRKHNKLSKN